MANTPQLNPFKKDPAKNTQLTLTLTGEQRAIVEQLGSYLGIKTNTGVAMEALAALYDKHRRALAKGEPAPASAAAE